MAKRSIVFADSRTRRVMSRAREFVGWVPIKRKILKDTQKLAKTILETELARILNMLQYFQRERDISLVI